MAMTKRRLRPRWHMSVYVGALCMAVSTHGVDCRSTSDRRHHWAETPRRRLDFFAADPEVTAASFFDEASLEECSDDLFEADANRDKEINSEEFASFVGSRSQGQLARAFQNLPANLVMLFYTATCSICYSSTGDDKCCVGGKAHMPLPSERGSKPLEFMILLEFLCPNVDEFLAPTVTQPPTAAPMPRPYNNPTRSPSQPPTTSLPTLAPSKSELSLEQPSNEPTAELIVYPTISPTPRPTWKPTMSPTQSPTTERPSMDPSRNRTAAPSMQPTPPPTMSPTRAPTLEPTQTPIVAPTKRPSRRPTIPLAMATNQPTATETAAPIITPTRTPTKTPTVSPTAFPTARPTLQPTVPPTFLPTSAPTARPTFMPTDDPTAIPTKSPTLTPTSRPNVSPTLLPTRQRLVCVSFAYTLENTTGFSSEDIFNAVNNTIKARLIAATENVTINILNSTLPRINSPLLNRHLSVYESTGFGSHAFHNAALEHFGTWDEVQLKLTTLSKSTVKPTWRHPRHRRMETGVRRRRLAFYSDEHPVEITRILESMFCPDPTQDCVVVSTTVCVVLEVGDDQEVVRTNLINGFRESIEGGGFNEVIPK